MEGKTSDRVPMPQLPLGENDQSLFASINAFVHNYMSKYDNSHDYNHILRVLSNAHYIQTYERVSNPSVKYDTTALYLAALLHDVGDHKYAKPGEDVENQIRDTLLAHGANAKLADKVQTIVKYVSYTHEVRNPDAVKEMLLLHPELGIVQDADRIDAIGAVGIGRCFSFGAAKMPDQPMERAVTHFEEKLFKLVGMMKTGKGREMARERHVVLEGFAKQWKEETRLAFKVE
ncbi:hypothetical protein AA0117_g10577 [Alternaria alternata]|jgi:uncharacterized protein|uniref:HD/PDEase domain-containing protein n=1 Tax=Alternaria alternata TaxID=5599 RepID=A0A4Q4N4N4_ALTAL|nr:hypothetical protein AA0117_g10577 [Alternaria alternata]